MHSYTPTMASTLARVIPAPRRRSAWKSRSAPRRSPPPARAVHHGHGGLVAAALDGEDEVACGLDGRLALRAAPRGRRPRTQARAGPGSSVPAAATSGSAARASRAHRHPGRSGAAAPHPARSPARRRARARHRCRPPPRARWCSCSDLRVVGHTSQKAWPRAHGGAPPHHIEHLEVVAGHHAAGLAHDAAHVVRHPPGVARLRELRRTFAPGVVGSVSIGTGLQGRNLRNVVHGHGRSCRWRSARNLRCP